MFLAADPVTPLDIATLILGIVGTALAVLGLILQWFMWRRSAGRAEAILILASRKLNASDKKVYRAGEEPPDWPQELAQRGFNSPMIGVRVVNTGRMPIFVESFAIQNTFDAEFPASPDEFNPPFLAPIAPHASEQWFVPLSQFGKIAYEPRQIGVNRTGARFIVTLANGKRVHTKWSTDYNLPPSYRGPDSAA